MSRPITTQSTYRTRGGLAVRRQVASEGYDGAIEPLIEALDTRRGVLLASSFEYPGRYTRWDLGFVDPPLAISCRGRDFCIAALNDRGLVLLPPIAEALAVIPGLDGLDASPERVSGRAIPLGANFDEEDRTRQPSVFTVLRAVRDLFFSDEGEHLGLYGAFGYDLAFQFDPVAEKLPRADDHRDLVLYLPDEILVVDHRKGAARRYLYDFETGHGSTEGLPREGTACVLAGASRVQAGCDHAPGEYAAIVGVAKDAFVRGDLFEVVPGQTFFEPCAAPPSEVFRRLRRANPAPYGAFMNLGEGEYLVAASPEMFVRVDGRRIETCPISGTIARGRDAVEDAARILELLQSQKDEAELTMCTDVDRNDKARVCVPGSVRIIGRRQIEMYSRLIHTVDHVEGVLGEGYDAIDGFLTHCWAVTVTGAPKPAAMQFIEDHERSPRRWYGGAIGFLGFDGSLNTGLTLRTVRIKDGVAEVRAGATLLTDSDPEAEEAETRLKASALLRAIRGEGQAAGRSPTIPAPGARRRVLMVDHRDSFVHMLAGYFREAGAEVTTVRSNLACEALERGAFDLAVLSPGPGVPADFAMPGTIQALLQRGTSVFGVCLGMQGIVEYFGGTLGILPAPVHGKKSGIRVLGGRLFADMPETFTAGRYHSLHARAETLPEALRVTAMSHDGVIMAVEHRDLAVAGVQFHPESLMTLGDDAGRRLICNVLSVLVPDVASAAG